LASTPEATGYSICLSRTKTLMNQFGPLNHRGTTSTAKPGVGKSIMERMPNVQSFGSGNVGCGNITSILNSKITVNEIDEDSQIKKWLSPLTPQGRHQSVQSNRVEGVGGWLLESNEFREWSGAQGVLEKTVLFCYGDPGVGKTHIRSVRKLSRTSAYH